MQALTDMMGYKMILPSYPKRIVSLVPSQTELLYDLGLENSVVGITKFCIHPEQWFRTKQKVGGTKTIHIDKVKALQPDLIIANKEENTQEQVEALRTVAPVWTSDINDIDSSLQMIASISNITQTAYRGAQIIANINEGIASLQSLFQGKKVAYFIWKNPWMSVGCDTFIHDILTHLGAVNIFANHKRYPIVTIEATITQEADYILLSSEPFPFQQKHIDALIETYPLIKAKILIVDGEMFSWYGSRMQQAFTYFKTLAKQI